MVVVVVIVMEGDEGVRRVDSCVKRESVVDVDI